jgi:hypothetical protein
MPTGQRGEKRPADETEKLTDDGKDKAAVCLGRRGGKARATTLSPARRAEIARKAANKQWKPGDS